MTYAENDKSYAEYLYRFEGANAVAKHFGIDRSTVYSNFKRWGVEIDNRVSPILTPEDPRMASMLGYIKGYYIKHEFSPSVRNIADGLSISSTSVVVYRLDLMEKYGLIKRTKNVSRSIVVLERNTV